MYDLLGTPFVHLRTLHVDLPSSKLPLFSSPLTLTSSVASQALSMIIFLLLNYMLYNLYLSPLARARIPGPVLAAVLPFDLWLTVHGTLRLRQCRVIHQLFDVYGPVVRVGPRMVVFKDLEAGKVIYGGSLPVSIGGARGKEGGRLRFDKSSYYKGMVT